MTDPQWWDAYEECVKHGAATEDWCRHRHERPYHRRDDLAALGLVSFIVVSLLAICVVSVLTT